jgi:hypothetical protein
LGLKVGFEVPIPIGRRCRRKVQAVVENRRRLGNPSQQGNPKNKGTGGQTPAASLGPAICPDRPKSRQRRDAAPSLAQWRPKAETGGRRVAGQTAQIFLDLA